MKIVTAIFFAAWLGLLLSGCSLGGKQGAQQRYNDSSKPIGYYSNDKSSGQRNSLNDNHGIIMKMVNNSIQKPAGNTNQNNIVPLKNENPIKKNEALIPTNHGTNETNRTAIDEARIKKAASGVKNVKNVQAVELGRSVVISVTLQNEILAEKSKAQIMEAVRPYLAGRTCTIITDKGTINKKMNRHNDLLENGAR